MPQQGYSTGRDVTLAIILGDGTALRLGQVTSFDAKPENSDQKIKKIDGNVDHLRSEEGWNGSFKMERSGPDVDAYFTDRERRYYAGQDEPYVTVQQTIRETTGAVSQYRFTRVILKYDDPGMWSGDKTVSQTISFMASRRIQQA